jgi:hypothetical protein
MNSPLLWQKANLRASHGLPFLGRGVGEAVKKVLKGASLYKKSLLYFIE